MINSLAIGSFDAIHLAHQELIKRADGVLVIEHHRATITPGYKRSNYTKKATFFYLLEDIKHLSPQEFIKKLTHDFPALKKIVVGYDFRFGKNAKGDIRTLQELFHGDVEIVDEIKIDNISVHSRVIRTLIKESNITLANKLLGRNYKIDGEQIRGLGLGSKKLVPTINLKVQNYTLPEGVFISNTFIDKNCYPSLSFLGKRLSVNNSFSIETHILTNFTIKKYSNIEIEFLETLRENRKFNSLVELKEQIEQDRYRAKIYHKL